MLLVGRRPIDLTAARATALAKDVELLGGTSLDDVREAMRSGSVDTVIVGAGIPLAERLAIVEHVYEVSDTTTVHMKDRASGPDGMLPFVGALLKALA